MSGPSRQLQFGHGSEAVETKRKVGSISGCAMLQFGHGSEAVETFRPGNLYRSYVRLQFGHGSEAVETPTAAAAPEIASVSFNSATAVKPWKRLQQPQRLK